MLSYEQTPCVRGFPSLEGRNGCLGSSSPTRHTGPHGGSFRKQSVSTVQTCVRYHLPGTDGGALGALDPVSFTRTSGRSFRVSANKVALNNCMAFHCGDVSRWISSGPLLMGS